MNQPLQRCPNCNHLSGARILYGYPTPEAVELAERGVVFLGGCCELLEAPDFQCLACSHEWRAQARIQTAK